MSDSDDAGNQDLSPFQRSQAALASANDGSDGTLRHKLVLGACCLFSVSFLSLSALDLKTVFTTPAMLDKSFKLTYPAKRPSLPSNLFYLTEGETGQDGFYRVFEANWNKNNVGLVNKNGNVILRPQYASIGTFNEGLAEVLKENEANECRYGFIDSTGKTVIEPRFNYVHSFNGGVAVVSTDSNSALVDRTGKVIFQSEPNSLNDLGGIYSVTGKGNKTGLIDNKGKQLLPPEYDSISSFSNQVRFFYKGWQTAQKNEEFFRITKDGSSGVIDRKGNIIMPPTFSAILSYQNGHAVVRQGEKFGIADSSGKFVIKPIYDFVTAYDELIAAREGTKWKLIDGSGNTVNGAQIEGVVVRNGQPWFSNGRGAVIIGDQMGYVDKVGQIAIKPSYTCATQFENGFARVYDGKLWNFIDTAGRAMTNFKMVSIENFPASGPALVTLEGPLYGFGKAPEILSENGSFKSQITAVKMNTKTDATRFTTE